MTAPPAIGFIDRFSVFRDTVALTGWCFAPSGPVEALELRPAGFPRISPAYRFHPVWLPSPDVAGVHGPQAARCRFSGSFAMGAIAGAACGGTLAAILPGGATIPVATLGAFRPSAASDLTETFHAMVAELSAPEILEVGARARSGITRRDRLPPAARYTGCDILPGENVDVVCDAHALSDSLPRGRYHAVMAFSVLEHLLMPWKFVLELNAVLAPGAIGLFTTHQCWPIHDAPWDFWRFSDGAWRGLLNPATGFEIIATAMGEPAYIVAADCHQVTNFSPDPAGFLASNVLFRKTGQTELRWDVSLNQLISDAYPA